jgi:hypothetical protein
MHTRLAAVCSVKMLSGHKRLKGCDEDRLQRESKVSIGTEINTMCETCKTRAAITLHTWGDDPLHKQASAKAVSEHHNTSGKS